MTPDPVRSSIQALIDQWLEKSKRMRANAEDSVVESLIAQYTQGVKDCANELANVLASLPVSPPLSDTGQWQDIESAPKDGTPILGCRLTWTHPYVFCYLNGPELIEGWHDFNVSPVGRRPHDLTHWRSLPPPPLSDTAEPKDRT